MYGEKAAAGTAGLTIDCLAERPVVGKPLVNESVELSMLSQKLSAPIHIRPGWPAFLKMSEIYAPLYFKLRRKEVNSEGKKLKSGIVFP